MCVCVCVCVCARVLGGVGGGVGVCERVYAFRIVSVDRILCFTNTFIIIIIIDIKHTFIYVINFYTR